MSLKLNNSIGYTLRVIMPGDELSLVHEVWWGEPPIRYSIPKGARLFHLELSEFVYAYDPDVSHCVEGSNIYHKKIEGM